MIKKNIAIFNFSTKNGGSASVTKSIIDLMKLDFNFINYSVYGESHKTFFLNRILHRLDNIISFFFYFTYQNVSFNIIPTNNYKYVNSINVDLLHFNWIHFNFFSIWEIKKINKPIIWTIHDSWFINKFHHLENNDSKIFKSFINYLNKKKINIFINSNIQFICPSKYLYNKIIESNLFKIDNVHQIYNPVNFDFWKNEKYLNNNYFEDNNLIRILFVTSEKLENPNKGFNMIKEISNYFDSKEFNLVFDIVSPLSSNDYFLNDIKSMSKFNFLGKKDKNELLNLYCISDMVIMPSFFENLPTVLIEALGCSCPVIGYSTGGIPEIIVDKYNGRLVKNYTAANFIEAIIDIKKNLSLYKSLTRKSVLDKFNNNEIKNSYIKIYNKLTL
jgi:glycosyltransferase involved in cell wall biosynthesis